MGQSRRSTETWGYSPVLALNLSDKAVGETLHNQRCNLQVDAPAYTSRYSRKDGLSMETEASTVDPVSPEVLEPEPDEGTVLSTSVRLQEMQIAVRRRSPRYINCLCIYTNFMHSFGISAKVFQGRSMLCLSTRTYQKNYTRTLPTQ